MSFHAISNILNGATSLQTAIDNSNYDNRIGIRSLTVWIGWYNTDTDSWMAITHPVDAGEDDGNPNTGDVIYKPHDVDVSPGLRGVKDIVAAGNRLMLASQNEAGEIVETPVDNPFHVDYDAGICTIIIPAGLGLVITESIRAVLGIGKAPLPGQVATDLQLLGEGTYKGQVDMWPKFFDINLKQIGTSDNILDGKNYIVLSKISILLTEFGNCFTITPTTPLYKKLTAGIITEMELTFTDCNEKNIDNHGLPISVELEII